MIVPRKTVGELRKLLDDDEMTIAVSVSETKVRFATPEVTLTSKVIDGTFPDYARVIPTGNAKRLEVDAAEFAQAVDRVATVSSERSRAVKMALEEDRLVLIVNAPDSGAADEELAVAYGDERLEIGFNAKYLLEIAGQVDRENAVFLFNSAGDPTLMREGNDDSGGLCRDADAGLTWLAVTRLQPLAFPLAPRGAARARRPAGGGLRAERGRQDQPDRGGVAALARARAARGGERGAGARRRSGSAGRWSRRSAAPDGAHEVATWSEGPGRRVEIDGKAASQTALGGVARVLWLTPAMDRLWLEAAGRAAAVPRPGDAEPRFPTTARWRSATTAACASATG